MCIRDREYIVPARGLIGFRTEFLTETRGTGLLHHIHENYEPWAGAIRTRPSGSLVADRRGVTTGFALANLQERGSMFVGPGTEAVSYTHLRAHETVLDIVCRLLLE